MTQNLINATISRAEKWMNEASQSLTPDEKKRYRQLSSLIEQSENKLFLMGLLDRCFRSNDTKRTYLGVVGLLNRYGIPSFLSRIEQKMILYLYQFGIRFTRFSMFALFLKLKQKTRHLILSDDTYHLIPYLLYRGWKGFKITINRVGERVLGEKQAAQFIKSYESDIRNPHIHCVSIKLSSLCSTLYPLGELYSHSILIERLSHLFELARSQNTAIMIDMEEFRYAYFTLDIFKATLSSDQFKTLDVGIVIQAYLKDSLKMYQHLYEWAKQRVDLGASPIQVRLVKGANLQMESIDTSIYGWESPLYTSKRDVDSNFKRLIQLSLSQTYTAVIRVGIGSHNLFDLAFAYELAKENNALNAIRFELLEGVANHIGRTIQRESVSVLFYTPVSSDDQFVHSIGYLFRRFDEHTSKKHFLRHLFNLSVGSEEWDRLKIDFLDSISAIPELKSPLYSHRFIEDYQSIDITVPFRNEPITDWRYPKNRTWATAIRDKWRFSKTRVPISYTMDPFKKNRSIASFYDRSLSDHPLIFKVELADQDDISRLLKIAKNDPNHWRESSPCSRYKILSKVALLLRQNRSDFIGIITAITGKSIFEGDIEVSEAIDFIEFYCRSRRQWEETSRSQPGPIGTGLIITPWNFPLAIPCGGIVSSLVGGNTTILKPSPKSLPIAMKLVQCFWEAGIPKSALQIAPVNDIKLAETLFQSSVIDFVIFTGHTQTAKKMRMSRPNLPFFAETGGKNAIIVTSLSDREQAIQHIVTSAFGFSGQKCSAASLLVLEKEVYDDPEFKRQLSDAVSSVRCGSPWHFENRMSYLVQDLSKDLHWALTSLDHNESWAVKPHFKSMAPPMISPGLKWNVQRGSFMHKTELFGPVLSVMCADSLSHAVQLVNDTGYGLTSGLESLDLDEQDYWTRHIHAGNLYINREITGAVVNQQPFGGMGKSSIGPGLKAGGPFYITSFVNWYSTINQDSDLDEIISHYKQVHTNFFIKKHDPSQLLGEHNHTRFLPVGCVGIRVSSSDPTYATYLMIHAALIAGCQVDVSLSENYPLDLLWGLFSQTIKDQILLRIESEDHFIERLDHFDRLRLCSQASVSGRLFELAAKRDLYIECRPVLEDAKLELIRYFWEQTISNRYHRYGNTGLSQDV